MLLLDGLFPAYAAYGCLPEVKRPAIFTSIPAFNP
jgi:hypothetical protein